MSTVKKNELESWQAYYFEPKKPQEKPKCQRCGRMLGFGYVQGDKCDFCIAVDVEIRRRQKELNQ